MSFSRLVTFGCSLTFGMSLDDNYSKNEFPSKFAWPVNLAKLLNVPLVNNGKLGASNKEILYTLLNYNFKSDDIVFVLWSHPDRYCIITDNNEIELLGAWKKHDKKSKAFFKTLWNSYDRRIENYFFYNLAHFYLQQNNIKHVFLTPSKENIDLSFKWSSIKFLNVFFNSTRNFFPFANDNNHPGLEAHEHFAQTIYNKYLIDEYYTGDEV